MADLREGFTTGSCAAAAALACCLWQRDGTCPPQVGLRVPAGKVYTPVIISHADGSCGVIKDSGDDPDITNGMEVIAKVELLNEYEAMIEELKTEAEAVRDSIKAEMMERETEELIAGSYIIRWTSVLSNRFDSTAFKKVYGDLYKAFTKQSASRRFSISC